MSWAEGLMESEYFLALATQYYLEDLRNQEEPVITQVLMAKRLKKPVVILREISLTEEEQEELKGYFKGMDIVLEVTFDRNDKGSMERAIEDIAKRVKS